jgi:uncharacterized tellurite resistance protein B-like protein
MLKAILDFFDATIAVPAAAGADDRHSIELATAALLVEVVRIDVETTDAEREAALRAVREKFGLSGTEAATLIDLAEQEVRQATDYYQFTSLINRRFTPEQKRKVMELMWRVAYADEVISAHERHLLRKIADLLHLTPGEYLSAQARAREAPGHPGCHPGQHGRQTP